MTRTNYKHTLTREEEVSLHARMVRGDQDAFAQLCESVMPWGVQVAKETLQKRGIAIEGIEELMSIAGMGIVKAVLKFDPRKNCRLTTYARAWVVNVASLDAHNRRLIRIPIYLMFRSTLNHPSREQADRIRDAGFLSLSSDERHDGDLSGLHELSYTPDPGPNLSCGELPAKVQVALAKLPSSQAYVLQARFMRQQTLSAIGEELGLTRERIRQIEVQALASFKTMWCRLYGGEPELVG